MYINYKYVFIHIRIRICVRDCVYMFYIYIYFPSPPWAFGVFFFVCPRHHGIGLHCVSVPGESYHVETQSFDSKRQGHHWRAIQAAGDMCNMESGPIDTLEPHGLALKVVEDDDECNLKNIFLEFEYGD